MYTATFGLPLVAQDARISLQIRKFETQTFETHFTLYVLFIHQCGLFALQLLDPTLDLVQFGWHQIES